MRRTNLVVAKAIGLAILVAIFAAYSGPIYRYAGSGQVGWALKKQIRDAQFAKVDLAKITPFKWDELYIFPPYAGPETVCAALSMSMHECISKTKVDSNDDGLTLLAFKDQGKLVHAESHLSFHGDFVPVPKQQPVRKHNAVFRVVGDGKSATNESRFRLVQIFQ